MITNCGAQNQIPSIPPEIKDDGVSTSGQMNRNLHLSLVYFDLLNLKKSKMCMYIIPGFKLLTTIHTEILAKKKIHTFTLSGRI